MMILSSVWKLSHCSGIPESKRIDTHLISSWVQVSMAVLDLMRGQLLVGLLIWLLLFQKGIGTLVNVFWLIVWIIVFFIFIWTIYERRWCNITVHYAWNEGYKKRVDVVVNVEIIRLIAIILECKLDSTSS
jgi:hypothetical protein